MSSVLHSRRAISCGVGASMRVMAIPSGRWQDFGLADAPGRCHPLDWRSQRMLLAKALPPKRRAVGPSPRRSLHGHRGFCLSGRWQSRRHDFPRALRLASSARCFRCRMLRRCPMTLFAARRPLRAPRSARPVIQSSVKPMYNVSVFTESRRPLSTPPAPRLDRLSVAVGRG